MLRPLLGRESAVWRWLRTPRLRYAVFRDPIDCVIYGLLLSRPRVDFVQIGSNDGQTGDPLWRFRHFAHWRGILVEPVEPIFRRLKENYAPWADRFVFENVAIAREGGRRPFYHLLESDGLPAGFDQLGSLDEELLRRHARLVSGGAGRVVASCVNCTTLRELCEKHGVRKLDLLHIDAEGLDYEILEQVDWDRHQPSVVVYEHVHLEEENRRRARTLLERMGYQAVTVGSDSLAVKCEAMQTMLALKRSWYLVVSRPNPEASAGVGRMPGSVSRDLTGLARL